MGLLALRVETAERIYTCLAGQHVDSITQTTIFSHQFALSYSSTCGLFGSGFRPNNHTRALLLPCGNQVPSTLCALVVMLNKPGQANVCCSLPTCFSGSNSSIISTRREHEKDLHCTLRPSQSRPRRQSSTARTCTAQTTVANPSIPSHRRPMTKSRLLGSSSFTIDLDLPFDTEGTFPPREGPGPGRSIVCPSRSNGRRRPIPLPAASGWTILLPTAASAEPPPAPPCSQWLPCQQWARRWL